MSAMRMFMDSAPKVSGVSDDSRPLGRREAGNLPLWGMRTPREAIAPSHAPQRERSWRCVRDESRLKALG